MKPKYAFHLGRVFTLSLAELFSVFEDMKIGFRLVDFYREVLIVETDKELNAQNLQKRLGGTIKIMSVMDSLGRKKYFGPAMVFKDYFEPKLLEKQFLSGSPGKVVLGISVYPLATNLPLKNENKNLGLLIKRILSQSGRSVRVVFAQKETLALPSVVVGSEKLLEKGAELDFLVGSDKVYLAKTLSIQDFEDYGRRDYQRPARDDRIGMLPPKVAQIMLNLAHVPADSIGQLKHAVLDPFAGSGTIIQEAMLMGFKGVGSDISAKAVEDAEKNLLWFKNRYKLPQGRFELLVADAKDLLEHLPTLSYEAIVTEGTLGPAYATAPGEAEIKKNLLHLQKVYLDAFKSFRKILPDGKRVVIALPAYRRPSGGYHFLEIIDKVLDLGYHIVDPLPSVLLERYHFLLVTPRKSIIYDRKDQFVSREILIFSA